MKQLQIRMRTDDIMEVLLYDTIGSDDFFGGGISAKTFRQQIKATKAKVMNLRVNSPGGNVFEAGAMMAALDEWPGRIEVDIDGVAASAASYLIMAADVIRVASNGLMMVHDPFAVAGGGSADMRRMADLLDTVRGQILDAYERKSKAGREQLSAWMQQETWFTGPEAVAAGLADEATGAVRVAALAEHAQILAKLYKHTPELPQDHEAWEQTAKRREIAAQLMGT